MNKEAKKQAVIAIGVALIVVALILFAYAFSAPKEYVSDVVLTTASTTANSTVHSTAPKQSQIVTSPDDSAIDNTEPQVNVSFPLNLNTCTEQELTEIKGIGSSRASAIIQYREYLGGYTSVEQIKDIKGIGEALYEKISPYLTV